MGSWLRDRLLVEKSTVDDVDPRVLQKRMLATCSLVILGLLASSWAVFSMQGSALWGSWLPLAWRRSPYRHVQFLGLNLFTLPGTVEEGCIANNHTSSQEWPECYLGPKSVAEDLRRRLDIMLEVIERTYQSEQWDRDNSTLKVFVAPEFFWRGRHGAYQLDQNTSAAMRATFQELRMRLANPSFGNWIFALGTIVASDGEDARTANYYNVAPVHIGGSERWQVAIKNHVSKMDFLQPQLSQVGYDAGRCWVNRTSEGCNYKRPSQRLLEDGFGLSSVDILQDNVLTFGALRIGLEICLDHFTGELDQTLGPWRSVDIHLITSSGMSIASGPVCTRRNGPVFLADGSARTELALNEFGHGRQAAQSQGGSWVHNVGTVYGVDSLVALERLLSDAIKAKSGVRFGGDAHGSSMGMTTKLNALGDTWLAKLHGLYDVAAYQEAERLASLLHMQIPANSSKTSARPVAQPTVDVYTIVPLQ